MPDIKPEVLPDDVFEVVGHRKKMVFEDIPTI